MVGMTTNHAATASTHRALALLALALLASSCARAGSGPLTGDVRVGPPNGSVVVVGGGAIGIDILAKFIELAGGPDALIIDVPTSGGAATYTQDAPGARAFRAAGAKNVLVLHTTDRKLADTDSFVAPIKRAGGVWFDGGRHYRLVDSYGGSKSEQAFHDVLARGGVTGGSSAGASILGSYLVRGAPSNNNLIMAYPGYEVGFGFLRGVGIDQHVVARERLPDLADSIMPKHPELLLISEDEGTAWVVRGDVGEIIGKSKAFVYGGKDATDKGKPFLTLHPGDKYNLATRRIVHRAIDETNLTLAFVDSLVRANVGASAATVLVAQNGKVLVNTSYNVASQRRYMPATTMPNFPLGMISDAINGWLRGRDPTVAQAASRNEMSYAQFMTRSLYGPTGMHKTQVDTATGAFMSNVDELYRWEHLLTAASRARFAQGNATPAFADSPGWDVDAYRGTRRQAAYGAPGGKRNAYVRFPERLAAIIVLTDNAAADVRPIVDGIANRLLPNP